MKIAITGTRGIPNRYGGFEQFAEYLSSGLARKGHTVWVYNPRYHEYREKTFDRVSIVRKWLPEKLLGPGANYIYDFLCLRDAVRKKADIVLECGYASASPSYPLLSFRRTKLVTHMDGMEWKRSKWNSTIQKWIRKAEKKAVRYSDALICDHPNIIRYYAEKYNIKPVLISYGAEIRELPDERALDPLGLKAGSYFFLVARLEQENNIQMIIEGFLAAEGEMPLVITGDYSRGNGQKIHARYSGRKNIVFLGSIFDQDLLFNLRHFSKALFHGHSVGGTNPSLLEAMAAGSPVIAHDNPYNREVLGDNGCFFNSAEAVRRILLEPVDPQGQFHKHRAGNMEKIRSDYRWEKVVDRYEELFRDLAGMSG